MAEHRESVRLVLNENFTAPLARAAAAARTMFRDFELAEATWEPHDWDDLR